MKRIICIITICVLALCLSFSFFGGCSAKKDGKMNVVVTIFPVYDWVMNVLGDRAQQANVTLLLDSGADLHSYQPSFADMIAVAEADLFLYIGGESDDWVDDALKNARNKNMRSMNLLSLLGDQAYHEEIVEGMEHEEEEDGEEYDEHVWLSLKNAKFYVGQIKKQLAELDPAGAEEYEKNAATYLASLEELDCAYQNAVKDADRDTLLFGDRFPFRYLVEDYGLKYYAAFVGCSAETNASFETMRFLANKADELDVKVIFKLENSTGEIAEGVRNASAKKDQSILVLDSLQSATKKEYQAGRTYLSVMASNLEALEKALSE